MPKLMPLQRHQPTSGTNSVSVTVVKVADQKHLSEKKRVYLAYGLQVVVSHQGRPRQKAKQELGGRTEAGVMVECCLLISSACFLTSPRAPSRGSAAHDILGPPSSV